MTVPTTLYEDGDTKVVQLSSHYNPTWDESINELKAILGSQGIELHRFKNGEEQEMTRLDMTSEEVDTLCSVWMAFQAEQGIKAMAEKQRTQNIIVEARELAEKYPITIKHDETDSQYWDITCDAAAVHTCAYSAEALLERVKETVETYLRHLEAQAWIDEAHKIAESCPAIGIYDNLVDMKTPNFHVWTQNAAELLEAVKKAKATYEEWQDKLIRTND